MNYVSAAVNENTTGLQSYLDEIISISKEKNYKRGIQAGYMTAQIYHSDRGDFANSLLYADSAFKLMEGDTAKRVMVNKAYLYSNVAGDYLKLGDYEQAASHYTRAAELLEKYQPQAAHGVYGGLAEVYDRLLQPQKAIEYDEKAIAAAEKSGNKLAISRRSLNYIVRMINVKEFNKAEVLLRKIEPLVMEVGQSFSLILFYQNKAYLQQHKKNYDAAVHYFKLAHSYAIQNDDNYQQITILDPLANCLMEAGKMREARLYIDTLLAKSLTYQMKFGQLNAYNNLTAWYEKSGDYATAIQYLNKKILLADSISSDETKEKITMIETRFKVRGKDNEIKVLQTEKLNQQLLLRQKTTINYILIGSAAALLIISLLGYRSHRHKQKLQQARITELETEKQLAAAEAVLKGEEQERTRLAKDLHDGLGGMLSGIKYSFQNMKENLILTPENAQAFERSIDMLDSSIKEMRQVAHNLMPEMLVRYGLNTALKEFCNEIDSSRVIHANYQSIGMDNAALGQTVAVTVYRIVQELVNNAIKHANAKNVLVQVHLEEQEKLLTVTVEDDGKGFDTNRLRQLSSGIGWSNIRNRVEFLKGRIDVNSGPGKGTSVLMEIHLE